MKLKPFFSDLIRSDYSKDSFTLASGNFLSQIIIVLITPILTRIFSPEQFGAYSSFVALFSIISIVSTGRYEIAILIPEEEKEAVGLFRISAMISFIFCLLCFLIGWLCKTRLEDLLGTALQKTLLWIPLGAFLQAVLVSSGYMQTRERAYRRISVSRIIGVVSLGLVSIALGLFNIYLGLIIGKMIGLIFETYWLQPYRLLFKDYSFRRRDYLDLMKKFVNFPKYSTFEALFNNAFKQLPFILLTFWFSPVFAGFYSIGSLVISKPLGIISSSMGQVFLQRASVAGREHGAELKKLFFSNVILLSLVAFFPTVIILALAGPLFALVFGEEWRESGIYAIWLLPFVIATIYKTTFAGIVDVKNRIGQNALFEGLLTAITIVAFIIGKRMDSPILAVQLYSLSCAAVCVIQVIWYYQLLKRRSDWG